MKRLLLVPLILLAGLGAFFGPASLITFEVPTATAQNIHLPMVGRQFPTLGLELHGGTIFDWTGDDLDYSPVVGPRARVGLHHIVTQRLSMNAEFSAGASYFGEHPVAPDGQGPSQIRFDWRLGLLARHFQLGEDSGWTFAGGLNYRRAHLQEGSLIQFGPDLRLGRFLWTSDERFLIIELAAHTPVFSGLTISDFTGEIAQTIPTEWYHPSMSLAIQWAF